MFLFNLHGDGGAAAGAGAPRARLCLDGADPHCPQAIARLAGRIYRAQRHGARAVAILPGAQAAAGLRLACERIGISPEPELAIGPGLAPAPAAFPGRPLKVALAGYGVVGQALARRLAAEPEFEIVAILVRDPAAERPVPPPCPLTADRDAFLAVDADILVDALSCDVTGAALSLAALALGRPVASASKRAVAREWAALAGDGFHYSAAVGGGAPVLETVAAARAAGAIESVTGVLNGTVNFLLHRLHKGYGFAEALAQARKAGFAEEDSSFDLSGADAAAKLKLIAAAAFGCDPNDLAVRTEALTPALAETIRAGRTRWVQLARLTKDGAEILLRPAADAAPLRVLPDEWNSVEIALGDGRRFGCAGRGAGGAATAEAIVADLFEIRDRFADKAGDA